jgi:hypothetical protein
MKSGDKVKAKNSRPISVCGNFFLPIKTIYTVDLVNRLVHDYISLEPKTGNVIWWYIKDFELVNEKIEKLSTHFE